jgi:hypothetical protein
MPSNIIHNENTTVIANVVAIRLNRKKHPMKICSNAERKRDALLGRKRWVLKVKMSFEIPEIRVKHPINNADANKVSPGFAMQNTPKTMRRMLEMTSHIFVLLSITVVLIC